MARRAGITRKQVVDAAVSLADRDGLSAVSLATVAAAVGVRSPSLYAHVEGVRGLRRDLALRANQLLAQRLAAAAEGHRDPEQALRALGHAYRAFALEHPGLYASLLPVPRPDQDPEGAAVAAETVAVTAAVLAELGITPERHVDLIRALRAMLHGFVDLELGGGFGLKDPVEASFGTALDLVVGAMAGLGRRRSG